MAEVYNSAYTGSEIDAAIGAVRQKEAAWDDKQDALTGTQGQFVGFDAEGKPAAQDLTAGDVTFSDGETFQQKYDSGELTGPAGAQGEKGDKGDTGAAGPQGETGADGKSPYAVAVEAGYTGTEAEFYAALVSLQDGPFLPLTGGTVTGSLTIEAVSALFALMSSDGGASLGMMSNSLLGNIITHTGALQINASDGSDVSFGESTLKDIGDPADDTDAATKGYVDALKPKAVTITLTAAGWSDNTQTVTVSGVSADETAQLIQPVPSAASQAAYIEAGILCTGQAEGSLTFTAETAPTEDLTVYVVITEVTG